MILDNIESPKDLKNIPAEELPVLTSEIRNVLINKLSKVGGHFGSNLGVVELTIALHYVFDTPKDKIVFDVSHQCYTHKILTGRKEAFLDESKFDNVTGFTNPDESIYDSFDIGHTSTSISLAAGLAKSRDLAGRNENVIAVIGDSALEGGEAFEALNIATEITKRLIVVVNDNDMSIPEPHGALRRLLNKLKENNGVVADNYFKSLGFDYLFVKDGHDLSQLIHAFNKAKNAEKPIIVHCCTQKGKGYPLAEQNREKWHHAHPFDIVTGEFKKGSTVPKENYGSITGSYLSDLIQKDPMVVAMTASVPTCFGFNQERRNKAGKQYVDVGIAEQNMLSMAGAIAKDGGKPVIITESSFYQRAYDQIEQEVCRNKCPITMLIAFSGIYAHEDDTHIGFFDIPLFANIPNLIFLAPSNKEDYVSALDWSINQKEYPVAIRIPWNGVYHNEKFLTDFSTPKYKIMRKGKKIAIMGLGSFYQLGEKVADLTEEKLNITPTLIDPIFVSGYDVDTLESIKDNHDIVVTLEDSLIQGGFGAKIAQYYGDSSLKVMNYGFSMDIPRKFTREEMFTKNNLLPEQILNNISKAFF